ncbi:sulfite exporter TauE/SafE family protein [Candidatus Solincola tengchongensis]|uniref:sulfite exporter TauE/SafE family protein n=1 Tax=Candidatus Solincola tengchongensis TaxID=2900693 RepID=UPI00257F88AD
MQEFLFTILLGFASGFTSGAFGIGGGVITTPAIRLLLMRSSDIALGTPLPVIFPSAVVGGFNYWRAGKIIPRVVLYCSLFGLIGTVVGSSATSLLDTRYIMIITSLLIIYLAYRTYAAAGARSPYDSGEEARHSRYPAPMLACIGLLAGFFSGFLGVGGGVILVPAFYFLLHMELKECLGNSLVVMAFLVLPGSLIHSFLGHVEWPVALAMVLGVMPGSYMGSFFTLRARNRRVQVLFALLLLAIGIIFLFKEIRGLL